MRVRAASAAPPAGRWLGFSALAGAGMAAGQAPLGLWWLALPGLAGLIWMITSQPGKWQAAWLGWFGGAGYFAASMFWIVEPFMVDAARDGWMAPFGLLFLSFGLALFWALAGLAGWLLAPGAPALRALALAVTLAAAELVRSYALTGLPWALIGHIWIDTPVVQLASWVGPVGLTLLSTMAAAAPVALAVAWPARQSGWVFGVGAAGLVLGLAALWGRGQLGITDTPRDPPLVVRIVQPNAPQDEKWREDRALVFLDRQLAFTRVQADPAPAVTVWPETAVPYLLDQSAPVLAMIAAAAQGKPVILGVNRDEGGRYFNSLIVTGPDGAPVARYDKHHLVPFGEYLPLGDLLSNFGLTGFAARDGNGFSPGPGPALLDLGPLGKVLPLICYEAVFPQDLRGTARPDWLVQITNDAWFGGLSGPYQHLAQARLRAVEQGLPMVRSANTGISAMIDARGRLVGSLPLGRAGYIDVALPPALGETVYARFGDRPVALLLAILCLGLVLLAARKPVDRSPRHH